MIMSMKVTPTAREFADEIFLADRQHFVSKFSASKIF